MPLVDALLSRGGKGDEFVPRAQIIPQANRGRTQKSLLPAPERIDRLKKFGGDSQDPIKCCKLTREPFGPKGNWVQCHAGYWIQRHVAWGSVTLVDGIARTAIVRLKSWGGPVQSPQNCGAGGS